MTFPVHKVALVQLHPKPFAVESNYERAASFVKAAASQGAVVAVFPEYFLTNWMPEDPKFKGIVAIWKTYLEKLCNLAREVNICLQPGTLVELLDEGTKEERLVNVAYFIDNQGRILGRYEKKNLWHGPERDHLTSSQHDRHECFDTPLGPVGMLICWDLVFPEAFRELIAQGAKIIFLPTFWTLSDCSEYGLKKNPMAEKVFLEACVTARAYENTCAIIFVNAGGAVGRTKPGTYAGLSRLALPFVGVLGADTKDSTEEGMSIVDLDMQVLDEAERQYKVREDMAREDWWYKYRHDSFEGGWGERSKL